MYAVEIAKKVFEKNPCITNTTEMVDEGTRKVIRNMGESVILADAWNFISAESVEKAKYLMWANEDFPSDLVSAYREMQKEMMVKWGEA
jgi:hypothetical protein